jgi:hypothetical protein
MIVIRLLVYLAVTVLVEGGLMALFFRSRRFVYYSFLCNLLTNPALNLLLLLCVMLLGTAWYWPAVAILALAAVFVEAYVYRLLCDLPFARALGTSVLLNAVSFLAGIGLNAALGWSL